jgi:hypothetical protein
MYLWSFAEPARWLGETKGFWVQTFILTVSAVGAVWIVAARGSQEKRRATVDLIIEQKRDTALTQARHLLRKMHDSGEKNLAKHLEKPESEEYKSILLVLNAYEFVACGIRAGAFHEETYKRLRYSMLCKDWQALCGFILEIRRSQHRPTLFQDFQWLSAKWAKKPLKEDHPTNDLL